MTKTLTERNELPEDSTKEIRYFSDYQTNWNAVVPRLKKFRLETVDFLSIPGDAPKDFITDREYRPGRRGRRNRFDSFIAKVGSKYYPLESVTEQLLTRIGKIFGLSIADSKLRVVNGQVRFMSKYFLNRRQEQLIHGAQIFEQCLGKEEYAQLAERKSEAEFFSFQMVCESIRVSFNDFELRIVKGLVEMLAFDCLIGHNDRHPYNWGVIVPIYKVQSPRFAPIFDTARALFWNVPETRILQMLSDKRQLDTYISKCAPPFSWDGQPTVDFFRLMGLIWNSSDKYRPHIEKLLNEQALSITLRLVDKEFEDLMSSQRRQLIKETLELRFKKLQEAVNV